MSTKYRLKFAEWGWQEFVAVLCSPFVDYRARLIGAIARYYPASQILLANSARAVLVIVLEELASKYPDKHQVIVGRYICPSVIQAIEKAGFTPKVVGVNEELNIIAEEVDHAIGPSTLAVLVAHMYAKPAEIAEIQGICKTKDIFLIDDAAQVGFDVVEPTLGGFGDIGLISFAQSKTIVTGCRGSGGVLLLNSNRAKSMGAAFIGALEASKSRWFQLIYFLVSYVYGHYFGGIVYYCTRLKYKLGIKDQYFYTGRDITNVEAAIAVAQYTSVETRSNRKIRLIKIYKKLLIGSAFEIVQYKEGVYLTRLMIKVKKNTVVVKKRLHMLGVQTRNGYFEEDRLLELPLHSKMTAKDVQNICAIVRTVEADSDRVRSQCNT